MLQLGLQELSKDDWKILKEALDVNQYLNLYHIAHKYLPKESLPNIECASVTFPALISDGYAIQDLEISMATQILVKNKVARELCLSFEVSNKITFKLCFVILFSTSL